MRIKKEYIRKWRFCKRCNKKFYVEGYCVSICENCRGRKGGFCPPIKVINETKNSDTISSDK